MAYCGRCDRYFTSHAAREQHIRNSTYHEYCQDCDVEFSAFEGLKEHWVQSPQHAYCQHCHQHFNDGDELADHYEEDHWYCRSCNKLFNNQQGLNEHYRQSPRHYFCSLCKRNFASASNLQSHLNSSVHRPKDVACPFKGCGMKFVSRSALVLHLEGGACQSGMDRATVNRYVRYYDRNNVITDPSRLLMGNNFTEEVRYYATGASWNGYSYECYLCHSTYRTLSALNQHLGSPRHQDKIYRYPASDCHSQFPTLSALCQHIESEKCSVLKFKFVQNTMDSLLGQMGRLTMA